MTSDATPPDLQDQIPKGWTLDDQGKSIGIRLRLKDFMAALGLVNEIGMAAERIGHHPDLHLTGWNQLEVRTYSHDVGALTERDLRLAGEVDAILADKGIKPV